MPISKIGTNALGNDAINLASATVTGVTQVANGGTGVSTLTANNVILGNGTSTPSFVAPGTNGNVLTSNGTTWVSAAAGGGGSLINVQVFATAGTYTYTKTAGTNKIYAICIGGGGGGQYFTTTGASSGGAGGCAVKFISNASSITTATLRVGTGGGQSSAGQGSYIDFPSNLIEGLGGGGADTGGYNYRGAGGGTSGSDIALNGGDGGGMYIASGGYSGMNGGYPALFGVGGGGGSYGQGGSNGRFGGGGGGGGYGGGGGSGGSGLVVIYEYA